MTLIETRTEQDGVIRVERWPEGLVLWVGGVIAWKSWKPKRAHIHDLASKLADAAFEIAETDRGLIHARLVERFTQVMAADVERVGVAKSMWDGNQWVPMQVASLEQIS